MSAPTPALYTLSLHDALPISRSRQASGSGRGASCSERIRDECGQGTAILDIELIQLGDGVVVRRAAPAGRSEEHTSELQSLTNLVCRLLLEKKKKAKRARPDQ